MSNFRLLTFDEAFKKEDFLSKLFPDPWDAFAILLAFIVLLIVVFYFAYKPVKNLLTKRGDYVGNKLRNAEEKEKTAIDLLNNANAEVKSKKIEGMEIIENAKRDAEKERAAILAKAKEEKEAEVKKAKDEIAQEIEASKDDIHREIVSVAIDASSKVLEREVNEKLIDNFIDDLKKGE